MNQEELVLKYMKKHGGITSMQAFKDLYVTRLSAVIYNIKEHGYLIEKVMERNNKTGTHYARYFLVKKNGKR